jgi:hypothetical protein
LAFSVSHEDRPTYHALRVYFEDEAVIDWTLGLVLLERAMINRLVIVTLDSRFELNVSLEDWGKPPPRAVGTLSADRCDLVINKTEIGYWLRFYLTQIRDGLASADHIDIEVMHRDSGRPFDIELHAPGYKQPMSEDEARQALGLPPRPGRSPTPRRRGHR